MNSKRWRNLQAETLMLHPFCERCKCNGFERPSVVVHHIRPIESGHSTAEYETLAFDPNNLQALCHQCHADIHRTDLDSFSREGRKRRAHDRLLRWINDLSQPNGDGS